MKTKDYELIIEAYKSMVESLSYVNDSLSELVIAQHKQILQLQGIQTIPPFKTGGTTYVKV